MTRRLFPALLGWVPLAFAGCVPVSGERILAGDMAAALPAFGALAADMALGYAPAPGGVRRYSYPELARLARRYGVPIPPGAEACFTGPAQTLTGARVAAAMRIVLPSARIEVLDFSRQPVPAGDLQFPLSGLAGPQASQGPPCVLWRGYIRRATQSDFPVWAKARVRISGTRAVAAEAIAAGQTIEAVQLREEAYEGAAPFPDLRQIVGRIAKRPVAAGQVILPQWVEEPEDVRRGERVRVEVRSGEARLLLEGQAQSAGRRGQWIAVRNPASGRIFRARVEQRGQVAVVPAWSVPLGDSR